MATAAETTKMDSAIADVVAEKAYAAAAEKSETAAPKAAAPVAAPVAAKAEAPAPAKKPAGNKMVKSAAAKPKASAPAASKKVAQPARKITKTAPVAKVVPAKKPVAAKAPTLTKLKDSLMAKTQTTTADYSAKLNTVVSDVQERAKVAYGKSTAMVGDYTEFSKGNVQAMVEAGKILVAGMQDMGSAYVAEAKSAFETMTADVKEIAAVKSPTDFFKLQGEILRRNFDAAVAIGSKNSEAVVRLANDTFAPLSNRVSLAIEKVKKAA